MTAARLRPGGLGHEQVRKRRRASSPSWTSGDVDANGQHATRGEGGRGEATWTLPLRSFLAPDPIPWREHGRFRDRGKTARKPRAGHHRTLTLPPAAGPEAERQVRLAKRRQRGGTWCSKFLVSFWFHHLSPTLYNAFLKRITQLFGKSAEIVVDVHEKGSEETWGSHPCDDASGTKNKPCPFQSHRRAGALLQGLSAPRSVGAHAWGALRKRRASVAFSPQRAACCLRSGHFPTEGLHTAVNTASGRFSRVSALAQPPRLPCPRARPPRPR